MSNIKLSNLKARDGIDKKAIGRGIGSGCGKTSTYGHKGGKARSGRGKVKWFEGGQMPIYRRLPKRGFVSKSDKSCIVCINLVDLQRLCDAKIISAGQEINLEILKSLYAIKNSACTLRLLGKGELKTPLIITAGYATDSAIRAVEMAGGKVQIA
ncbi:MAG: 50S ribosomal protein L15 [Holosporaceae bacterium]|nr:50S ribosomal protein L15 [Holosporaceae bacterium]